jgi:AraC-like DNA-binding protein
MTLAQDPRIRFEASGTDLGRAVEQYTDAYRGTGFAANRTSLDFSHRHTAAGTADFTLRGTRFGARMSGEVDMTGGYYVSWITEGDAVIDVGRDETVLRPGIPTPFPTGRPHAFDFADVVQNLVHFDAAYLERVAGELHGRGPLVIAFDHSAAPDQSRLATWRSAVSDAAQVVLRDRGATEGALALAARRLATALLRTFPHELRPATGPSGLEATAARGAGTEQTDGPIVLVDGPSIAFPAGAGDRVRAAITHMHEHAHEPISSTDVARAVGLSVRGLQQAFQRQVGESPNAHLRAIRLDRVRTELRASAPGTTVAAVARHWGFAHLGRFAASYTERFGEYPRDTLLG